MESFWQKLSKPLLILAPMEDVTDTVFRRIVASCARPDVFFTEFTNVDGLVSEGEKIVSQRLVYTQEERPIVAQIWGKKPEHFYAAAQKIVGRGFDGIDINFGCPERSVVKNGCCAAMIGNNTQVKEIIDATRSGAGTLPLSLKTRLGYKTMMTQEWISFLLEQDLDALTIHGRTAAEMSAVPAHWDEIGKAVAIRNAKKVKTLIIGNGDVTDAADALEKVNVFGVDGVMIGRGIFENPWAFDRGGYTPTKEQLLHLLRTHVRLYEKTWGNTKHYPVLKKYFKIYVRGFDGASELRTKLMETRDPAETEAIMEPILGK